MSTVTNPQISGKYDVGTAANNVVQLDASGKLPAVDGSQLTNVPGDISSVTAGTGLTGGGASGAVTLNVNVGTTSGKIVQLDGSGKLPAIDGSQLTNLPGGGASTSLNNLASTSINTALVFAPGAFGQIKTADETSPYNLLVTTGQSTGGGTSGSLIVRSNNSGTSAASGTVNLTSGSGAPSGGIILSSGDGSGGAAGSGNVNIHSGDADTNGASGNVIIATGAVSGGTKGKIELKDGSEGTAGHVWTSTDTIGTGHWAAASGGGLTNPVANNTYLNWRNATDDADLPVLILNNGNQITLGNNAADSQIVIGAAGTNFIAINNDSASLGYISTTTDELQLNANYNDEPIIRFYNISGQPVGLRAASHAAAPVDFVLPNEPGDAGQVLSTDGSGGMSWVDQGAGGTVTLFATDEASGTTTIAGGAASGIAPTVSLTTANSVSGKITYTAGAGATSGEQVIVTFGTAYASAPLVYLTPANDNACDSAGGFEGAYVTESTTNFTITTLGSTGASQFKWNYLVIASA